jgi:hypothetical protein
MGQASCGEACPILLFNGYRIDDLNYPGAWTIENAEIDKHLVSRWQYGCRITYSIY